MPVLLVPLEPLERAVLELLLDRRYGYNQLPYNAGREELRRQGLDVGDEAQLDLDGPYCRAVRALDARGLLDLSQVIASSYRHEDVPLTEALRRGLHVDRIGGPFRIYPEQFSSAQRLLELRPASLGPRQRLSPLAA